MIKELSITNYAIIDQSFFQFSEGLNIITGETGAGKSILLGALGLVLGNRADSKVFIDKGRSCVVEALFSLTNEARQVLAEEGFEEDSQVLIRRELSPAGKSRIFINDQLATLKQVQKLCQTLVDLHQQFENLGLNDTVNQMRIMDEMAGTRAEVKKYQEVFHQWKLLNEQLRAKEEERSNLIRERDYLEFQCKEFEEFALQADDAKIETRLEEASKTNEIRTLLQEFNFLIAGSEEGMLSRLRSFSVRLNAMRHLPSAGDLPSRLESLVVELGDLQQYSESLHDDVITDPEEISALQDRMDKLGHLLHKHQVREVSELAKVWSAMQNRLQSMEDLDDEITQIESTISSLALIMEKQALKLRKQRQKHIAPFEKETIKLLQELRMVDASFKISLTERQEFGPNGKDNIEFLFAANKGADFRPLKDTASGGELSRISLVIKSLIAENINLPTLIFDEIDSGVSGDVAQRMGEILSEMAKQHQIVSITHSPQVAARADLHFKISKASGTKKSTSTVQPLDKDQSIHEIAVMLSSSPPSKKALASATELVKG